MKFSALLVRLSYPALIVWQWLWQSGLMSGKSGHWQIAAVITLLMIWPLPGVFRMQARSMTWGGFAVLGLFVIAIGEAWSDPSDRTLAAGQILLCCTYMGGLFGFSRKR